MREYIKKSKNQSRILDSHPNASKQTRTSTILQAYNLGRENHRKETFIRPNYPIQRVLKIGVLNEVTDSENDEGLKTLIDDNNIWMFKTLNEAKNVGRMVKMIKEATAAKKYEKDNKHSHTDSLYNLLVHFRDSDHSDSQQALTSLGKYSNPFDIQNPGDFIPILLLSKERKNEDPNDQRENKALINEAPNDQRENEALITAIKLKSMNLSGKYKLYGSPGVDYLLEDEGTQKQYGFDPFKLPKNLYEEIDSWLKVAYEKHVRTKERNIGKEGKKAHYSGLLDISGLNVNQLNFLLNKIFSYEQVLSRNKSYEVPNLSLVNSWLTQNNVADFDFPQEFDLPTSSLTDIFGDE